MKRTIQYFALLLILTTGCQRLDMSGMFYGSSARSDERFAQSMAYNEEHGYKTVVAPADEYKVYFATDFHVDSTTLHTEAWVDAIEQDADCAVAIILGDMVNGRKKYPYFMAAVDPLLSAGFPLFATAGNHDTYFSEWPEYVKYWGTSTYYFEVQTPNYTDLYISIDTSDGTVGRDQMEWLRKLLREKAGVDYRHKMVFTHTHMFKHDGAQGHTSNFPIEETYEITSLLGQNGVDWYMSGHRHSRHIVNFEGVTYYQIDAIQESYPEEESFYFVATVGETLAGEFIHL